MDIDIMWHQINELVAFKTRALPMLEAFEAEQAGKRDTGDHERSEADNRGDAGRQEPGRREDDRETVHRPETGREPGRAAVHPDSHRDARDTGRGHSGRDK
jgi:hypothetical protein